MYVGIQRDSSLATLLKVHCDYQNASENRDTLIDDEENGKEEVILGDFAEVNDEIVSNIEEIFSEEDLEWQRSDATSPIGWLFNETLSDEGSINKAFMSPCKVYNKG